MSKSTLKKSRAFTLVEMLIAVGAVALLAVGLAKLFSSTGKTVSAGRRISNLNEIASTFERQIRADVASMTRDGILVIRNKYAAGTGLNGGVLLSADDRNPEPRRRRIDELAFFATGSFTSQREPQHPSKFPVGSAARIYYGHGVQAGLASTGLFAINDHPGDVVGAVDPGAAALENGSAQWPADLGETGPNEYASGWTLLRHVAVLSPEQFTADGLPTDPGAPAWPTPANWADNAVQSGLTPTARSVFSSLEDRQKGGFALITPSVVAANAIARANDGFRNPSLASGLVDVVNMDLSTVRARVLNAPELLPDPKTTGTRSDRDTMAVMSTNPNPLARPGTSKATLHDQKIVMASILPGYDEILLRFNANNPVVAGLNASAARDFRMRYENSPPDFTGRVAHGGLYPADEAYRRQDQAMLTTSKLVAGCTEFIVEWSFGKVYGPPTTGTAGAPTPPYGRLIWHGLSRGEDLNGDGVISLDEIQASPYEGSSGYQISGGRARQRNDSVAIGVPLRDGSQAAYAVGGALVHWPADAGVGGAYALDDNVPLYSFFGYVDPTFVGGNDPTSSLPDTVRWPWPRLLRITMSLADPKDPTNEQTYQFVIELPSQTR